MDTEWMEFIWTLSLVYELSKNDFHIIVNIGLSHCFHMSNEGRFLIVDLMVEILMNVTDFFKN